MIEHLLERNTLLLLIGDFGYFGAMPPWKYTSNVSFVSLNNVQTLSWRGQVMICAIERTRRSLNPVARETLND